MIVVSVRGRAGQGAESAVNVLARAAAASGLNVQSLFFPSQERRGAPVFGLVKMDKAPITSRQPEPTDFSLILDSTLDTKDAIESAKEGSAIIINTSEKVNTQPMKKKRVKAYALDATGVSLTVTGRAMPNMAMLGALAKNFNKISMKSIKTAAETIAKENLASVDEGYKNVKQVK